MPRPGPRRTTVGARLDASTLERLDAFAARWSMTRSQATRHAIRIGLQVVETDDTVYGPPVGAETGGEDR